jgi:hypothetical protein
LNKNNYTVLANWEPVQEITFSGSKLTLPGLPNGYVMLAIFAVDTTGEPIFGSFELLFGSSTLPIRVIGVDGEPAAGVLVQANATTFNDVGQSAVTDSQGFASFSNVPQVTIGIVARTSDNEISVDGVAGGTTPTVILQLLPVEKPKNDSPGFQNANGTSGWKGGEQIDTNAKLRRDAPALWKRDTSLVLATNGLTDVQLTSKSFSVKSISNSVYIEYLFQTDEIPGGYFGTQFNDYFSITIRSDTGDYSSVVHSMNELGRGAFDAGGSTTWNNLRLEIHNATFVEFNVAVSNVGDGLFDSLVKVRKVGEEECDKCEEEECDKCPSKPKCQDICKDPPVDSCAFYRTCVEATTECGGAGFALDKGEKTCGKFQHNKDQLSAAGQTWVSKSEQCLQKALVPYLDCDYSCDFLRIEGFDSVTDCYLENGYCSLEAMDYAIILVTVFGEQDLDYRAAIKAVISSEDGCAQSTVKKIAAEIQNKIGLAAAGTDKDKNLADAVALTVAKAFHQDQVTDGDLTDITEVVKYIQQVYDTAVAFNNEVFGIFDVNRLSFQWFRQYKYAGPQFVALQGIVNPSFIDFAKKHGLPFYDTFIYPDYPGYPVGFDHLGTSTEAVYIWKDSTPGDVGGWLGDLFTFYNEWQKSTVLSGYDFCIQSLASATINTSFKLEDALQDADAFNMALNIRDGSDIAQEFKRVLQDGGNQSRFSSFFNTRFSGSKAEASNEACAALTDTILNPLAAAARLFLISGSVTAPRDLPDDEIKGFCDGFAQVFAQLA